MSRVVQGFPTGERGSTRLGLIIAGVVIAVLAATGVPLVFGQAHDAQDAKAQSSLARLAGDVEQCRLGAESYRECDERTELTGSTAVSWGRGSGQAGLLAGRSAERSYTAYAVSANGSRLYVWNSQDSHVTKRDCGHSSVERMEREGCRGPGW
jgi:Tfp pilus assembly protein FimT